MGSDSDLSRDRAVIRRTWSSIKDRCFNPNVTAYPRYGGRGICLWEPWRENSNAFVDWVLENLGPRPANPSGWTSQRACYSIDRIDVNDGYRPGNLKWSTKSEQASNTRAQLDPMNGIVQTPKASTFGFHIRRGKEKFAEYGFASPEDAARGRDEALSVLEARGPEAAREIIRRRTQEREDARAEAIESVRREALEKQEAARRLRDEAREARKAALELETQAKVAERKAREDEKALKVAGRSARWHEMNTTMTLGEIARAEGVSVAHVSLTLKAAGLPVTLHNSSGYPGVKKVNRGKRTYYEARLTIDGKRVTLGQRKTPEKAYELIVAAKARHTPVGATTQTVATDLDSGKPKRRTVLIRAA